MSPCLSLCQETKESVKLDRLAVSWAHFTCRAGNFEEIRS